MARIIRKTQNARFAIAVIVDGQDEKWYIEKVKDHYPNTVLRSIQIKPELADKKKVNDLFEEAKTRLNQEFSHVILIVDLDEPLKDVGEFERFKIWYDRYLSAQDGRFTKNNRWMKDLTVIINNPCLEYWYLLHFGKTSKYYADYTSLLPDLRKIPEMANYDKSDTYYHNSPDIYLRLDGMTSRLNNAARKNAQPFNLPLCRQQGGSEMNKLFDYIDNSLK